MKHRDLLVATITALAAIVGTLAGGLAGYLGNRALQQRELRLEQAKETAVARGVARLMREDLARARAELDAAEEGRVPLAALKRIRLQSDVSGEDRKLVAAQLTGEQWENVAQADRILVGLQRDVRREARTAADSTAEDPLAQAIINVARAVSGISLMELRRELQEAQDALKTLAAV